MDAHIRNPVEWLAAALSSIGHAVEDSGQLVAGTGTAVPEVRRIHVSDLWAVLRDGFRDFGATRSDVVMLCLIYPLVGLLLANVIFGRDMTELLFPIAAGFTLVGPAAAIGLYEMSRRRELGQEVTWGDAFRVVASPRFGAMLVLALVLVAIFALWVLSAEIIYDVTLGPAEPASLSALLQDAITTPAGWTLIVVGCLVGFLFALLVLATSVVSFPLMLDQNVGLATAVLTSVRAMIANPVPILGWGLIVAASLLIGSIPLFLGLAIVVPVLGHATWHLYRRVVVAQT
jgi:uncharacterized membrane protein